MEIPSDVLCFGSKSVLVDPVTTPDGQTYSQEVAISILQKNTGFEERQTDLVLYSNISAKQRVQRVRARLAEHWTTERLSSLTVKQLYELIAQLCDETITNRIFELPNIDHFDLISSVIRQARRKNNLKVIYKLSKVQPYICMVCCNTIDQSAAKSCSRLGYGHVNCVLTDVLRKKDFMVTIVQDCQRKRSYEYDFLPQKGFICLDSSKKRPNWMKEICMSVKRIMCLSDGVEVWYHPATSDIVVTNVMEDQRNIPYIWLVNKGDDLKSVFAQVWHRKNAIHIVMVETDNKHLVKEINAALNLIVKNPNPNIDSVMKLCYA
jgi:hypothetical protein